MAGNLLNIGKTGLFAAQAALSTTGHNIANANVAGYSRQQVVQGAAQAQNAGVGFVGSGTEITEIKRYSDNFLNGQVRTAQAASSALGAHTAQINQVDNLLADTTSGLSPALQDFFNSVQNVSANAGSAASRQSMLSSAETLAARFQGINGQLGEIRDGVNTKITSNVDMINSFAQQIAKLNDQIGTLSQATGNPPNDLLDARDQLVIDLNKQVKATVVAGTNNSLTVSIGSGQPLVVGTKPFQLAAVQSTADPSRVQVGYVSPQGVVPLPTARSAAASWAAARVPRRHARPDENALGRIAIGLAAAFNAQQRLGQDSSGKMGEDLFAQSAPVISGNLNPNPPDPSKTPSAVSAAVSDPSQLTTSDYQVGYDPLKARYTVTRLSDQKITDIAPPAVAGGAQTQTIDGIDFTVSGDGANGDSFLVRPTINGAYDFSVKAKDIGQIARPGRS
jgi:flagellar hook-associated protein 1 FlgK